MRILFVTQWFEPEPAFKGVTFATALRDRGHDVEVVTGFPNYPGGKIYPGYRVRLYRRDAVKGVITHRLALWPSHGDSAIGRMANYLSFFCTTLVFGLLRGKGYDLVYVYHPPVTPAAAAAIFCAIHSRPLVVEIQDLWPDSVVASGMSTKWVTSALNYVCRFVYQRATIIVAQSDQMAEKIHLREVPLKKLSRIYNWATYLPSQHAVLPASIDKAFHNRFNIVYGGNLGQAQALEVLIDAAVLAGEEMSNIHLHLFGDGIERVRLIEYIARTGGSRVSLHGPFSREIMDKILECSDALAIHLKDDPLYSLTIPSKVQHYLACGRPIVAGLAGEAARMLQKSGGALVCPPGDVNMLSKAMVRLAEMSPDELNHFGRSGQNYYNSELGFERALIETESVIELAASRYRS